MKLLYIGSGDLQQSIAEALTQTSGGHEVLLAGSKEELIKTLEGGMVDVLLFDCKHPVNLSLQQTVLYARAFKAPVIAITSIALEASLSALRSEGINGFVFQEHIGQLHFVIGNVVGKSQLEKEKLLLQVNADHKEVYYQTLLKNIGDFVFLFDEKGDLAYLSPSANQLTGFSDLGDKQLFEFIHPDDRKKFFYLFKKVLKKPDARVDAHFRILHKAGHYIWIDGSITNLVKNEAIGAFVLSCRDVTERTEMEQSLLSINRLYACIRQINRAILSVGHEQALFKEICYIATQFGNYKMAFISMLDSATGKLKLMQSSGVAEEDVEPSMVVKELENMPFEAVLQTGQCFVCNDVQDDLPNAEYWNYVARQKGFGSFIVLPLSKMDRIVGVFVLAASGTDTFSIKEIELLEETVDDISLKLDVLKKDYVRPAHSMVSAHSQHQIRKASAPSWR